MEAQGPSAEACPVPSPPGFFPRLSMPVWVLGHRAPACETKTHSLQAELLWFCRVPARQAGRRAGAVLPVTAGENGAWDTQAQEGKPLRPSSSPKLPARSTRAHRPAEPPTAWPEPRPRLPIKRCLGKSSKYRSSARCIHPPPLSFPKGPV